MTENEWLASEDPAAMLDWVCVPAEDGFRSTAQIARRPSDCKLRLWVEALRDGPITDPVYAARNWLEVFPEQKPKAATLLRDIVVNPFRPSPIVFAPEWLAPEVLSIAQAAYDERLDDGSLDPQRLAVLSDALEEEGCDNVELLMHLRGWKVCHACGGTGAKWKSIKRELSPCTQCTRSESYGWEQNFIPHVRGCWALDLILGKE